MGILGLARNSGRRQIFKFLGGGSTQGQVTTKLKVQASHTSNSSNIYAFPGYIYVL